MENILIIESAFLHKAIKLQIDTVLCVGPPKLRSLFNAED